MAAAPAKSLQSCPTLCDPIDSSPPGSPISGTLQARTLEWVAISFSNAWKWKVKVKLLSRVWLFATPWTAAYQAPPPGVFQARVLEWAASAFSAIEWQWIPSHVCSSLTRNHSPSWGSTFSCPYLTLRILPLSHITLFLNTQPNLPEAFTKYRRSPWLRAVFVFYYPAKIPQSKIMLRAWQLAWNVREGKPRDQTQWLSRWSHPPVHTWKAFNNPLLSRTLHILILCLLK